MTKVTIEGMDYMLRFDMEAMEEAEEVFGGMEEMQAELAGKHQVRATRDLFRIMANSAETYAGRQKTTTGREIMRMTIGEMKELAKKMMSEIRESIGIKVKDPDEEQDGIIVDDDDDGNEKNAGAGN